MMTLSVSSPPSPRQPASGGWTRWLGAPLEALRRLGARGYDPGPETLCPVSYLLRKPEGFAWAGREEAIRDLAPSSGGIGLVLPTYVSRASLDVNLEIVSDLLAQLARVREAFPDLPIVFFVGMQWDSGQEQEAEERLRRLGETSEQLAGVRFVGLSLPRMRKTRTLNSAFAVATGLRLRGVAWVDDDVKFAPDCLRNLVRRFLEKGCRGVVGARKIPQARTYVASSALHWAKQIMKTPAYSYPHGCCMMVDAESAAAGIPHRYSCDDGYFCFAQLKPGEANPLADLEVVADAGCHHTVGGPGREVYKRVRRSLFNTLILQADFPREVSSFYFSHMLFHGLWPLAPLDLSKGYRRAALRWCLKAIYFGWFVQVALELIVRALAHRPLREVNWAAYSRHEVPRVPRQEFS